MTERSLWALDVLIEEVTCYDAVSSRSTTTATAFPTPARPRARTGGRCDHRSARLDVRCGGVNLPVAGGGYFRLLPYRLDPLGNSASQHRRAASGDFLRAPLGIRSEPAAHRGGNAPAPAALP